MLVVIRLHGGRFSRRDIADVLKPALALSIATSVFAVAVCMLLRDGVLGYAVVVVLLAIAVGAYRGYARTSHKHRSLELVHEFVPARLLILELTETSIVEDADRTVPVLDQLARTGVQLSLDDFGTGYSSLSYLQRLPVQELKIDRSFVTALTDPTASHARALIRTIIALGDNLDLRIVSEGIETPRQAEELTELGCQVGQGYLFSRPLTADRFLAWLDQGSEDDALTMSAGGRRWTDHAPARALVRLDHRAPGRAAPLSAHHLARTGP